MTSREAQRLACKKYRESHREKVRALKRAWDAKNREHVKEYSHIHGERNNDLRRHRRQLLYNEWGRTGRQDWKESERIAVTILEQEGYYNIKLLTVEDFESPYDILAFRNNFLYAFQVTTRTHTDKKDAHRLAKELSLPHKALFISLQLEKYIIKDFSPTGQTELSVEEVSNARSYA